MILIGINKIFLSICSVILMFVIIITASGCTISNNKYVSEADYTNKTESQNTLNERQTKILKEEGLPTSFSLLTTSQQKSIIRIEELLQYLDNKYEKHFNYFEYSNGGILEDEWLKAYPDELNEYYTAKVAVDDTGKITDDYPNVIASILLADDLQSYLNSNENNSFKVFAHDCRLSEDIVSDTVNELSGKAGATFIIFVKGKDKADKLSKYSEYLIDWYKSRGIYGYANFIMLSNDYFDSLNIANYGKAKLEDKTEISLSCDITKDGQIKIY